MGKLRVIGIIFLVLAMILSLLNIISDKITGAIIGSKIDSSLITVFTLVLFLFGLLFLSSLEKKLLAGLIAIGSVVGTGYKIHNDREKQYLEDIKITSSWKTEQGKFQRTYRWDDILDKTERKYKLPKGILKGLAMRESYGDPLRLNEGEDGGAGLFMFQPGTAREYGLKTYGSSRRLSADQKHGEQLKDLVEKYKNDYGKLAKIDERFDIKKSAEAAAKYLKKQQNRYKSKDKTLSWDKALSAYNQGKAAPNPRQTKHVKAVREYQEYYNKRDRH